MNIANPICRIVAVLSLLTISSLLMNSASAANSSSGTNSSSAANQSSATNQSSAANSSSSANQSSAANPALLEAEKNLATSITFLSANKKQPGIVVLPSGLQYKILREGSGKSPGPSDFVTVHYRGTLINGTEFDSSYINREPATFAVNAVIPGWTEALQLMKPGSKWMVYLPPTLAYGKRGAGSKIGPNSALIFEIELLAIKPPFDENTEANASEWEDTD